MPDLFEIIGTTRSMRRLKPDPVPDELIKKILLAGTAAANTTNRGGGRCDSRRRDHGGQCRFRSVPVGQGP